MTSDETSISRLYSKLSDEKYLAIDNTFYLFTTRINTAS